MAMPRSNKTPHEVAAALATSSRLTSSTDMFDDRHQPTGSQTEAFKEHDKFQAHARNTGPQPGQSRPRRKSYCHPQQTHPEFQRPTVKLTSAADAYKTGRHLALETTPRRTRHTSQSRGGGDLRRGSSKRIRATHEVRSLTTAASRHGRKRAAAREFEQAACSSGRPQACGSGGSSSRQRAQPV